MKFFASTFPYMRTYMLGLFWTFLDSVGSQGGVIFYHIFLRTYAGQELHGAVGCLYSLVYLATAIFNLGLDKSLAPFLESLNKSKKTFHTFLFIVGTQLIFILLLCFLFLMSASFCIERNSLLSSLKSYLSHSVLITLTTTFFFESFRKTLRTFLQLSFYFKETAFIELVGIGGNILALPGMVYYNVLTIESILLVNAIMSIVQTILLGFPLMLHYSSLHDGKHNDQEAFLLTRMAKTRFFSWIVHCLSQLYTGNFLVPLCALKFGIPSASLLKVMTSIAYWISLISKNVFGTTSNAILAHLKSRSAQAQQEAFHYLSLIANQGLYCLLLFLLINGKKLAEAQVTSHNTVTWSLLYFILLISFFEGFFVLYEKWYIFEEDTFLYVAINGISIGILYFVIPQLSTAPTMLATILAIRIVTFICLLIISFYRWQIWPPLRPFPLPLIGTLAFSVLYYFFG